VSIDKQITNFEFEVCAIDDHSLVDPKPLYKKYLKKVPFKYKRLPERVGTRKSLCRCLDLISPDSTIIVSQSADVMYGSPYLLQGLCEKVAPYTIVMPEVRNISIPKDLYLNFERDIDKYLGEETIEVEEAKKGDDFLFYAGPRQPNPKWRWYMFLAAVLKKDLLKTCYPYDCFDRSVSESMHQLGFICYYLSGHIGIHQRHERNFPEITNGDGTYDI
jgi:hypothetical protein